MKKSTHSVSIWSIRDTSNISLLTPQTLHKLAGKEVISLRILSNDDIVINLDLLFYPTRDLIDAKLGSKQCHFEAISTDGTHNALSICSPKLISGLLRWNGNAYLLSVDRNNEDFILIPQKEIKGFSLEHIARSASNGPSQLFHIRRKREENKKVIERKPPPYYSKYLDGIKRYVELVFVADNSMYKKYKEDESAVNERLHAIANIANSLYSPLNIRVTLVYAEIWTNGDKIEVSANADRTLDKFMGYRKSLLGEHPHDNAQLITDVQFGSVIGKGYRGTMCSYDYSGGVINDHSDVVAFVGGTVAHEMGHNFGMDHDAGYQEPCLCPANSCVMSPVSNNINTTTFFSDCSLDYLEHAFKRGVDYCLYNVPESVFGGAKCGNGILEPGEECDCGSVDHCPNRCCIAAECRLAKDALCANGDCCDTDTCKPKPQATLCRRALDRCDLPEFCDGRNPNCPADFFVQNGHICPKIEGNINMDNDEQSYCWEGICGDREEQCKKIWGPDSKNGDPDCYVSNIFGTMTGNCGYDQKTEIYKRCNQTDVQCGRLQCESENQKPVFGDPSTVYAAFSNVRRNDGKETSCGVIRTSYIGNKRWTDPGMVKNGARCGKNDLCLDAECRNRTEVMQMVAKCDPENCNNKGVCNNVGNCHCIPGYGGVSCDLPGFGGSVNSGPASDRMFNPGLVLLYLAIVAFIAFSITTYYCKKRWNFWLHKNTLVPVRKAPKPPRSQQQTNVEDRRWSFSDPWNNNTSTERRGKHKKQSKQQTVLRVDASRPTWLTTNTVLQHQPPISLGVISTVHGNERRVNEEPNVIRNDNFYAVGHQSSMTIDNHLPPPVPPHRQHQYQGINSCNARSGTPSTSGGSSEETTKPNSRLLRQKHNGFNGQTKSPSPPPVPPHRNIGPITKKQSSIDATNKKQNVQKKKPLPPAKPPLVSNDRNQQKEHRKKSTGDVGKDNSEDRQEATTAINVRQIAARFERQ